MRVLHAVTQLTEGVRYSLFVVDRANGLGEKGVVESSMKFVDAYLATLQLKKRSRTTFEISNPQTFA